MPANDGARAEALCLGWDVGGWMGKRDGLAAAVLESDGSFEWIGNSRIVGLGSVIAEGKLSLTYLFDLLEIEKPPERWPRIVVGVDAPLGFPVDFVSAAAVSLRELEPLGKPPQWFIEHPLAFRETDRVVHLETGLRPLSPSMDSLANNTTKARAGCAQLRQGVPLARVVPQEPDDRSVAVIEVYPATWRRIKENEPGGTRLSGWFSDADAAKGPDIRDAMLCSLTAAAYEHTRRGAPGGPLLRVALPSEDERVCTEGWIYWPRLASET